MAEDAWHLRPLTVGDCDELGRVHMAVWREAYADLMPADYLAGLSDERCADSWREIAARAGGGSGSGAGDEARTLVVVDAAGNLAGFGSAGPSRDEDAPTPWELYAVNLASRARGTGVADRLLDELVGPRAATLWVVEGNARARAFYRRRGFADEGGRDVHPATGTPEVRMIRHA
ncbi:GNAT family N-acetyltransferase [Terrabacter carboxydivorans]|uniref:GNAT family N-acetyltransferase n=1 Tax=Terrabacter carboxydivorans TaxID=619730 RepID=A0ABN3LRA2_9MICO